MSEARWITNMKGVLYYLDTPVLDFEIKERQLVHAEDLSEGRFYPPELALYGVTYGNLNEFFRRRTMKEGCMLYREHMSAIGMDRMDFDRYVMMKNGNNNLDNFWIRYEGFGAQSFWDICNQDYPVC